MKQHNVQQQETNYKNHQQYPSTQINSNQQQQNNDLQVIVNPQKDKFIIAKKFSSCISIISPFSSEEDGYDSNFSLPESRQIRAMAFYQLAPEITQCWLHNYTVWVDIVSELNNEKFNNIKNGVIHYEYKYKDRIQDNSKERNKYLIPKLVLQSKQYEPFKPIKLEDSQKNSFNSFKLKIFPIILKTGYIISISDKKEAIMYFTLLNPHSGLIGSINFAIQNQLNKYINPLWPNMFNVHNIRNNTLLKINRKYLNPDSIKTFKNPLLFKVIRNFNDNTIQMQIIGTGDK